MFQWWACLQSLYLPWLPRRNLLAQRVPLGASTCRQWVFESRLVGNLVFKQDGEVWYFAISGRYSARCWCHFQVWSIMQSLLIFFFKIWSQTFLGAGTLHTSNSELWALKVVHRRFVRLVPRKTLLGSKTGGLGSSEAVSVFLFTSMRWNFDRLDKRLFILYYKRAKIRKLCKGLGLAIFRLTRKTPFNFKRPQSGSDDEQMVLKVPPGKASPYNAQATLHFYNAFWALLLPVSVPGVLTERSGFPVIRNSK